MIHYFFPNQVLSQNLVLKPNLVWVGDIFEFPILYKNRKQKGGVVFVVDIATNELLRVKGFLRSFHGGSIKTNKVCKIFKKLVTQRQIKNELVILNCDAKQKFRGDPCNIFYDFIKKYNLFIGRVNQTGKPKQNAVTERMVRNLKKQLIADCGEITSVQSVKEIQQFFDKKKEHYNYNVKPIKNFNHTRAKQLLAINL